MSITRTFRRGDTFAFAGPVRQSDGTAVDLTGWSVSADLVRTGVPVITLPLTAAVVDATAGVVRVSQVDTVTADWGTGLYEFKLRFVSPGGTVASGGIQRIQVVA